MVGRTVGITQVFGEYSGLAGCGIVWIIQGTAGVTAALYRTLTLECFREGGVAS